MTHAVMSDADKIEELNRQLANVEVGLSDTVLCPWCGVLNEKTGDDCCDTFRFSRDERGKLQLQSIVKQQQSVIHGVQGWISCPYCKAQNFPPDPDAHPSEWKRPLKSMFCCDLFELAVKAIAQRMVADAQIAKKKRIEDGLVQAAKN